MCLKRGTDPASGVSREVSTHLQALMTFVINSQDLLPVPFHLGRLQLAPASLNFKMSVCTFWSSAA